LITNGGYGAIQHALRLGIPIIVAGETEDKAANGALVQWSGVGINLAVRRPGVAKIREAFSNITANRSYADKAKKLSKEYNNYDVGQVFDQTIQGIVQNWRNRTSTKS
jgi:UDP:flavonoid glycosyltransferase YjiC (YdhE family)